jgi:hypothetical protein
MSEENTLANPIVQKVEVLGFRVSVLGVQLGQSARLAIHLNCVLEGAPFIQYKEIVIEGEEYTAWGADDTYIVELVKNKLTDPAPAPAPAPDAATPLTP